MRRAHAVAEIRAAEAALMARLPAGALMQRAAMGLASVCARLLGRAGGVYGAPVVVLAGSGDNGGDALYAGARLARRGAAVSAIAAGPRVHEGGSGALLDAGGGLLGIGGRGGLREPAASLAALACQSDATVVAADLPSGVDADTGEVAGAAIRADVTVTFGTFKPGLLVDPGAEHAGVTELIDIGLAGYLGPPSVAAPQAGDIAAWLPRPS